ncbi:hypothetical protein BH11BAC4_BH11BAC4_22780 [soil metagenome]
MQRNSWFVWFLTLLSPVCLSAQDNNVKFTEEMRTNMCTNVKAAAHHAWKNYEDYVCLVFAPKSTAELKKVLFTTEAHPLKIETVQQ